MDDVGQTLGQCGTNPLDCFFLKKRQNKLTRLFGIIVEGGPRVRKVYRWLHHAPLYKETCPQILVEK